MEGRRCELVGVVTATSFPRYKSHRKHKVPEVARLAIISTGERLSKHGADRAALLCGRGYGSHYQDSEREMTTSKADYGIDGPAIVRSLTIAGVIAIVVGIVGYVTAIPGRPVAGAVLSIVVFFLGVCMLVKVGSMMRWSKYAKLRERERLIDALEVPGEGA